MGCKYRLWNANFPALQVTVDCAAAIKGAMQACIGEPNVGDANFFSTVRRMSIAPTQSTHARLAAGESQTRVLCLLLDTCVLPKTRWCTCTCSCAGERTQPFHAVSCTRVCCLRRSLRQNRRAARRRRSARAAFSGSASRRMCRPRRAAPRSLARCASSRRCGRAYESQPVFSLAYAV